MSLHQTLAAGCEPNCHGCRHRNLTLEASLAQKHGYLARSLRAWGDRLADVQSAGEGSRYGYRDRVTLNARWDEVGGWRFGLVRRDELIAIETCPVHTPRVNRLLAVLRERLPPAGVLPLAYVHVAGAQATLVVKARTIDPATLGPVCDAMDTTGLEGLWVHGHPCAGRRLFARAGWQLAWGRRESIGPDGSVHGPTAFQQVLPALHARALDVAERHLAPRPGSAVLDLYCGIGTSLARWSRAGAATLGVELAGGAVECAVRNAPGAIVLRGTCEQRLPQVRPWWREQTGPRGTYVNPPRSGLESGVLAVLADELRPDCLAYLSCSAGTLARDLAAFEAREYVVERLVPYDFFPGTHHVECLALLRSCR